MQSSVRRDLALIVVLAVIILGLVEFRFNVTTHILQSADPSSASFDAVRSPLRNPGSLLDEGLDEYGEVVQKEAPRAASNPSALHYLKSAPLVKFKHQKHRKLSEAKGGASLVASMPTTTLVKHAAGFTVLDNVYLFNGTLYLVQSDASPSPFPETKLMISSGAAMSDPQEAREPTDENMQVISLSEAKKLFGDRQQRLDGTTLISYDHAELFTHYYHFAAEILFSLWRTYAALDPDVTVRGRTSLLSPTRFMAPHISASRWRDYANMNQYIFHAALPSTPIEFQNTWQDRAETLRPFLIERLVLGDRAAAARGADPLGWEKMSFHAGEVDGASAYWWEPIRRNVVAFSGGTPDPKRRKPSDVVITYISRQSWGRRMLKEEDHTRLVAGLVGLKAKYGWEVNVVQMEMLSREEQIALASRTTILMGVHGNGLTSLLWMQPGTTVMEFFYPEGFSYDYLYTAKMLGIEHHAFWNNVTWSAPNVPRKADYEHRGIVPGFQGSEIPIDADTVVKLCVERLTR